MIGLSLATCLNDFMSIIRQSPPSRFVPPGAFRLFLGGSPDAFTMEIHAEAHGTVPFQRAALAEDDVKPISGPFHLQMLVAAGTNYRVFVAETCPMDAATAILVEWLASYHPEMTDATWPNFT